MTSDLSFLNNIRTALKLPQGAERTKNMFPALFAKPDKSKILEKIANRSQDEKALLVDQFKANCVTLKTVLHVAETAKEVEDITVEIIRTKEPEFSYNRHIIQHNHPDISGMQLWKRFNRESVTVHTTFPGDPEITEKTIAAYIGITVPRISIAESGTLVQFTTPGCPRSTSLVPSIHIALIRGEDLVADLEEAYALIEEINPGESFVFISGPSKTADIEAHLVHGAHGPKEVHIILLKEVEKIPEAAAESQLANIAEEEACQEGTTKENADTVKEGTAGLEDPAEKMN
ncbi:MAG: hypothetical protein COA36_08115 [Desulfotalea sp.]|nr:MAG: hypothetical protein COA36_08115 [Desulfotalea sp.]